MRAPKILAVIGLAVIVLGAVAVFIPPVWEVWNPKSETLVKEVATVYPRWHYYPLALAPYIPQESRNLVVSGTVKELKGYTFDFYAFNKINYERWRAEAPYEAYLQVKNVSSYSFSFETTREDLNEGLYLVVLNIYAREPVTESLYDGTVTVYKWMEYD